MFRRLLFVAMLVLAPQQVWAWGQTGHRISGAIAEPLLSRNAARQVRAILGNETLVEASTWPDEERSNPDPFWQTTSYPWHFVTVPEGRAYPDVGAPPEGDSVSALQHFAVTLRDPKAPLEQKQLALRFTVHIIADLHQPLHVGNGLDRGGNDVRVTFFRESTNLHSVWDSGLIDRRQLSYTEFTALLQRRLTAAQRREWSNPDPLVWIAESVALHKDIYPESDQLSWEYAYRQKQVVDTRLTQSGVRIAAYLNAVFR